MPLVDQTTTGQQATHIAQQIIKARQKLMLVQAEIEILRTNQSYTYTLTPALQSHTHQSD